MTQDIFNQLDDATTVITGPQLSEFYMDLGADGHDEGGSPNLSLRAHVQASAAMALAGVDTIEVQLVTVPGLPYDKAGTTQVSKSTDTVTATGATNVINLTAHGLTYGDYCTFANIGASGLVVTTIYRVVEVTSADTFKVATTLAGVGAISADATGIVMTRYPSGCPGIDSAVTTAATDLVTWTAHGLVDGTKIELGVLASTTGILSGKTYWVTNATTNTFQFAATYDLAMAGTELTLTTNGTVDIWVPPVVHATTGALPFAEFTADAVHTLRIQEQAVYPLGQPGRYRYLFARYVPSSTVTALTVQAHIGLHSPASRSFGPSGFTLGV